jgi:hypothetical protein
LERVDGDPASVAAARDFLTSWFIDGDYEKTFGYLSPLCCPRYKLFRGERRPEAQSAEEAGRYLRERLELTGDLLGQRNRLDEFVTKVDPIMHGNSTRYPVPC